MKRFARKETIILKTEQQKDEYIDRLDRARVDYDIDEAYDDMYHKVVTYFIRVNAADLKKVS
ncbi:MAG: hypothetical protein ABTB30_17405 [Clostridia bacterium]